MICLAIGIINTILQSDGITCIKKHEVGSNIFFIKIVQPLLLTQLTCCKVKHLNMSTILINIIIDICRYKNRLIYVQRYYIITEKNTDTGFVYSLMSVTIQFSQKHFIFEMMYSFKLCNQIITIYCCIFLCANTMGSSPKD